MEKTVKDFGFCVIGEIAFRYNGYCWVCINKPKVGLDEDGKQGVRGDRMYFSNFKPIIKLLVTKLLADKTEKKETIRELINAVLDVGKEIKKLYSELSDSLQELKNMVKSEKELRAEFKKEYAGCKKCKYRTKKDEDDE